MASRESTALPLVVGESRGVDFHTTLYCWGLRGLSILRWDSAETGFYHNLLGYHYILVQSNHEV